MALGKRTAKQTELFVPVTELPKTPAHPFYAKLNALLAGDGFDLFVEELCERYYKEGGRPSIPPGTYFRMLFIGYFEGIDSQRGIAWRCADSLALRAFLGFAITEATPVHASMTVIRQRLPESVYDKVFVFVLSLLEQQGVLRGKAVAIDATTLEANAAMKSIVRRDSGESYDSFLESLAKESGIETPTRVDLARLDKKRKKKASNDDWQNPNDPDAEITKLKDGRTHLAHTVEHAVDLDSGAVMAVTIQPGARGDTQTLPETLGEVLDNTAALLRDPRSAKSLEHPLAELVSDRGYHSNETLVLTQATGFRSYISEPDRGRRDWEDKEAAQRATYANRRRIKGERGKALMRRRGELLERTFAHTLESGAMRRVFLRLRDNILKRYLVHVAAFNLSLVMRAVLGVGTPRELRGRLQAALEALATALRELLSAAYALLTDIDHAAFTIADGLARDRRRALATGC